MTTVWNISVDVSKITYTDGFVSEIEVVDETGPEEVEDLNPDG